MVTPRQVGLTMVGATAIAAFTAGGDDARAGDTSSHAFLGHEEEVVPLHHYVRGQLHAPTLCPHDDGIVAVEAAYRGTNRLWLVREPEPGDYALSPVIEVTPMTTPDDMVAFTERPTASYAGELAWCPADVTPHRYWYVYVSTDADGSTDLYLGNTEQSRSIRLTDVPGREVHPTWSVDGDTVVFVATGVGNGDLHAISGLRRVMRGEGEAPPPPIALTSGLAVDTHPSFSPDGREVLFSRRDDEMSDYHLRALPFESLAMLGADGTERSASRALLSMTGQATRGSFSPDARRIAFYHSEGAFDLTVSLVSARVSDDVPWELVDPRIVAYDVQPVERGPMWGPTRGATPSGESARTLVFLQRRHDGNIALACVDLHDDPVSPRDLETKARVISGFDFSGTGRGVITGQRGENYVAYRARLLGSAFRAGWQRATRGSVQ